MTADLPGVHDRLDEESPLKSVSSQSYIPKMSHDYDPEQWLAFWLCCLNGVPCSLFTWPCQVQIPEWNTHWPQMLNVIAGRKNTCKALHTHYTKCPIYYSHQTGTGWFDCGLQHSQ